MADVTGIVLTGGRSSRMGQEKASLVLGGSTLLDRTVAALNAVADDIVESLRLVDPLVIRTGIERENLFFACTTVESEEEKIERIADQLESKGDGLYEVLAR